MSAKIRRFVCVLLTAALCGVLSVSAAPYDSYTYEQRTGRALSAPAGVVPCKQLNGDSLAIGRLNDPSDAVCDSEGNLYILDSGNGRVVSVAGDLETIRFLIEKTDDVDFTGAQGLFVNDEHLYIADTDHARILRYPRSYEGQPPEVIEPKNLLFNTAEQPFKPSKLVVDAMNRIYVVCTGVFEGLVQLDAEGEFISYVGANRVKTNLLEQFWRLIATREQYDASKKYIPVEFSNVCLDQEGFIFSTARGQTGDDSTIRRLNLSGADVLDTDEEMMPLGDLYGYTESANRTVRTHFIDVAAGPYGCFAGLDLAMGRVFVYDSECTMLFVFGGMGSQSGTFISPSALLWLPNNNFGVLDRRSGDLTIFQLTEYGERLFSAVRYEAEGEFDAAAEDYKQILAMNANSELQYMGVGKQLFRRGEYAEAMKYFKLAGNRQYYSRAFEQYRKDTLGVIIPAVIVLVLLLTVFFALKSGVKKVKWLRGRIADINRMEGGRAKPEAGLPQREDGQKTEGGTPYGG